ncbi:hypothetical protein P2G88_01245 [Aliiglaciecola sp. CAU 1673]|uniref:hypothetical protein n=1 Tax=Aliiglaciecola sp. CAU 1673 TaxID=3032595 RepID=UPI0023DB25FC|nr:hypothetical protein [Aliiglaciecola sp. CAU 1673]MDF2176876.1 hypothetical protein [Aliiglaciecola sp. CAU 1673]
MNSLLFPGRSFRLCVTWVLCCLTCASLAQAENAPHTANEIQTMAALQTAKQDLISRQALSQSLENTAYDKTLSDTEGNQTHMRFDPAQPADTRWRVVSVSGKSLADVNLPSPFVLTPAIIDTLKLSFYEEEADYWVFKGDMDLYTSAANDEKRNDDEEPDSNFDEYLVAFVRIDKHTNRFCRMSFTNLDPFHPSTLATIKRFVIDTWYEPLVADGPLIARNIELTISGRYGFMYSFEEGIKQQIELIH